MSPSMKKRLLGQKSQQDAQARAFALAVIANKILAEKRRREAVCAQALSGR